MEMQVRIGGQGSDGAGAGVPVTLSSSAAAPLASGTSFLSHQCQMERL